MEEQRNNVKSISQLFNEEVVEKRANLVKVIESILLEDFESNGKKMRDVLWRKVYYDSISTAKRIIKQQQTPLSGQDLDQLVQFIQFAIKTYKTLILKFEDLFSLDIRNVIDFAIITNGADVFIKKSSTEIYTANEMNHAMETIHNFVVCLGDLHRYCIDFNFDEDCDIASVRSKNLAERYYIEAFKLNPRIGMPHNQLGTLKAGERYEIDSILHYVYSLCSPMPFSLSETNINRIFQQNIDNLERNNTVCDGFNVRDFIMQMILVIDIFFYDKDIEDFNTICQTVLMSFREYLARNRRGYEMDMDDVTFQITSILMLCLLKLKSKNSQKVHSLNAFLAAFCDNIIEATSYKVETFITDHEQHVKEFAEIYNRKFVEFEKQVKELKVNQCKKGDSECEQIGNGGSLSTGSSQIDDKTRGTSYGSSQKNGNHLSVGSEGSSIKTSDIKLAKKPKPHDRRRRRRCTTKSESNDNSSESDNSGADSDSEDEMNSDFDSYDDDDERFSTSDEDENDNEHDDDDDDIIIENEEIVYSSAHNDRNGDSDSLSFREHVDDVVIEEEEMVFPEIHTQHDQININLKRMKYKKKYSKVDPNLILQFHEAHSGWMKSLKILFDWLRVESKLLLNCFETNPEFINKIMKLVNLLNIDIFTRKVYFDRSMIHMKNVRSDLRYLFDIRYKIATTEDVFFKKFLMFDEVQQEIEWDLNLKLQITSDEDVILRNFKIIDFGFFMCKIKKLRYNFCARTRVFIQKNARRPGRERRDRDRDRSRKGCKFDENQQPKDGKRRRVRRRNRNRDNNRNGKCTLKYEQAKPIEEREEYPPLEQPNLRRGYLKSKNSSAAPEDVEKKNELMGKLWLKSEIKTLESKKLPSAVPLSPYIMPDSKCLSEHFNIVKNLVSSKKFVLLIPQAGKFTFLKKL